MPGNGGTATCSPRVTNVAAPADGYPGYVRLAQEHGAGLAVIGPVRTAIVSTIEPFWTALLGGLVLRQALGPRTLLGGVCIASAVVLLQLGQGREATPEPV